MQYEYLVGLKKHSSWKLLGADSAPLIISFFHRIFIKGNRRTIPASDMIAGLDDYLFHLRRILGDGAYPRQARAYLDEWAGAETGFLRKFYPSRGEEAEYDLTPASEKVLEWVGSFTPKQFVGTESRLLTIFRLLKEIVTDAMVDPDAEILRLEMEKEQIERKLANLKAGYYPVKDSTRIRERFLEACETSQRLLSDFRQVEENFRQLDRKTREKITISDSSKGELLDEIFGEQDAINGSDQGKSFRAFWQYIMSPASQEELELLLRQVLDLPDISDLDNGEHLERIRFKLIDAGERVNETRGQLVEQLRKFLDEQTWLENRRIMEIIRNIEKKAVKIRERPPQNVDFTHLDHVKPDMGLPMARGLFQPPKQIAVNDQVTVGKGDFKATALYEQQFVDKKELISHIRSSLKGRSQVTLVEICEKFPVKKGLTELLTYLQLASESDNAIVESDLAASIIYEDMNGHKRKAVMPEVIFVR